MSELTHKAVFLSYASQDAEAAKRICEALRAAGIEVWFDADGGLEHGDEWDAKIRRQIKECVLFLPIISANTQAREEGYFRLEWDLAVERARTIASGVAFILPVVIDDTKEPAALVPDRFRTVQWTRLPGGNVSPEVLQRFLKLWSHRTGLLKQQAAGGPRLADDGTQNPEPGTQIRAQRPRWLAPVVAGGVIALLALVLTRPWNKTSPTPAAAPPAPAKTAASWSEARKLAERARALTFEHNARRADFDSASVMLEEAVKLEPNDATVWAVSAMLDARYIDESYDNSDTRRAAATHHADRAFALDTTSRDARLAQVFALTRASNYSPEAWKEGAVVLRALVAEDPGDAEALTSLAFSKESMGELDEALRLFGQLARFPGEAGHAAYCRALSYWSALRYREALEEVTQAVKLEPTAPALLLKGRIEMLWLGDLERARDSLAALPASALLEDGPATFASWVHFYRREYDLALGDLVRVPREFVASPMGVFARATIEALILRVAGRGEGAEAKARIALASVERRLVNEPNSRVLSYEKIMLLGLLGRGNEARAHLKLFRELMTGEWRPDPGLYMMIDDKEAALGEFRAIIVNPRTWTAATIRLDPLYEPLRTDPRFQAILAQAERDPRMSPTAPDPTASSSRSPVSSLPTPSNPPEVDAKSVAVLAFANLSDDKGNEYFSDGISEELLNVLAKVPGLKVSARTSAFYFKGKQVPMAEIAQQLGVAYVIEGSVRKQGDKVRITAQLIKAADGFHVWSDTFTRDLKDVFAVQDEIAGLIAQNLRLTMGASASGAKVAVNPEAFELYVEARQAWNLRTLAGFDRAEELLNRALALEPGFARAYAALSDVWGTRGLVLAEIGQFGRRESPLMRRILAAAERAVELDPTSAEAQASLGNAYASSWRFAEAIRTMRHAISLNPNYASAHQFLGRTLLGQGFFEEAAAELARAAELDPLSHRIIDNNGIALLSMGRPAEALAACERALALKPDSVQAGIWRARCLTVLGRHDEAVAQARRVGADPGPQSIYLVEVFVAAGLKSEAEAILAKLDPKFAGWRFVGLLELGHYDEALAAMDPAEMSPQSLYQADLDPVRGDPRFKRVLATLGLTEADARIEAWNKAHPKPTVSAKP
jgi:TolB-like protein/predicted Zn-dependent protease